MIGVQYKDNAQLEVEEAARLQAEKEAKERQNRPVITSLVQFVLDCWEASKEAKQDIESRMIDNLRRKNGIYDPTKQAEIQKHGGSEIFMMLTDEKVSAVVSWLSDILFPAGDKPWGIKPTPVPELTPNKVAEITNQVRQEFTAQIIQQIQAQFHQEVVQMMASGQLQTDEQARAYLEAKAREMFPDPEQINQELQARAEEIAAEIRSDMEKAAKEARDRVETKLHDVLIESSWEDAVHDALDDVATFPAGIVKGPILRRKKVMKWKQPDPATGQIMEAGFQGTGMNDIPVEVVEEVRIDFNRVSPFDIYPLPNARKPEDGIIERHRLTRRYLTSLIGVQGYDDDAIRMVLKEYGSGGQSTWLNIAMDQTRQELENRPNEWRSPESMIDALQFWGNVQGLKLLQYGMSPEQIQDPFADYAVEIWIIGNYVIKAEINGDPMGRVPYNFASFRKRNGSIWGAGVPDVIKDSQDACNAAARSMVNNMAIASGPQVMVDVAQLPVGENVTAMYPWKLWQVNRNPAFGAAASDPIKFFMPPSVAKELMGVYQFFSNEADTKTGVPKYSYGGESKGGALGTATGFSMMMGNATRGIKNVVRNIDKGLIEPTVLRTHQFQLFFFKDPEFYAGDVKIIARGSTAMIAKEQAAVRRNELLNVVVNSEAVLSIIGKTGLASMLREIFQSADFKDNEIVPEKKEMLQVEQQEQLLLNQQAHQEQINQETDPAGNVAGGRDARTV